MAEVDLGVGPKRRRDALGGRRGAVGQTGDEVEAQVLATFKELLENLERVGAVAAAANLDAGCRSLESSSG